MTLKIVKTTITKNGRYNLIFLFLARNQYLASNDFYMTEIRYNLELHENSMAGRVFRIALGIICLAGGIWFMVSIGGTTASTGTAWIATAFLLVFSLWMIASGTGYLERFITVGDTKIVLKHSSYMPAVTITTSSLSCVTFKALSIEFHTAGKNVTLRLGNYYQERSVAIMEAVEAFCSRNSVETKGLEKKPEA